MNFVRRMAMWKHYIFLFGGFYDPGIKSLCHFWLTWYRTLIYMSTANYLNDLWYFDTQEYHWYQVEMKENERKPSYVLYILRMGLSLKWKYVRPRSGFSFLSTTDGIVLHGGYCKEYSKGKRPIGVMLDDTWFLRYDIIIPIPIKILIFVE